MAAKTTADNASSVILTIVIPTFNRANSLESLLLQLESEASECEGLVAVNLYDNHSTDNTCTLCMEYASRLTNWRYIRHNQNIGPDLNFISAVTSVESEYFWMIGDDDLPITGSLALIIEMLQQHSPSLVYLNSIGKPEIKPTDVPRLECITVNKLEATQFARTTNIMCAFISALIVNHAELMQRVSGMHSLSRGVGSFLIQLGWVFPLLRNDSVLIEVSEPCILATTGTWSGYNFFEVFLFNYLDSVHAYCKNNSAVERALISSYLESGFPLRIRGFRNGEFGSGFTEERFVFLRSILRLSNYKSFWTCVLPAFFPFLDPLFILAFKSAGLVKRQLKSSKAVG